VQEPAVSDEEQGMTLAGEKTTDAAAAVGGASAADAANVAGAAARPLRLLTIDVEDYFHIEAARGCHFSDSWNQLPLRVDHNVNYLLELLATHQRRATFFMLGHVARRRPHMAQTIRAAGHEIACHGFMHDRIHRLTPAQFRRDAGDAKALLEDQIGAAVLGYRAPTFSVTRATAWAVDVLAELGFTYDSSIFPVWHPQYGVPDAPVEPFFVQGTARGATMLEAPPLVWQLPTRNLPVAGGGYFRLLPLWFMRRGLGQAARRHRPAVLYFHPWEFDPRMPRMNMPLGRRIRTYTGLQRAGKRLARIIGGRGANQARWSTMSEALEELRTQARRRDVLRLSGKANQIAVAEDEDLARLDAIHESVQDLNSQIVHSFGDDAEERPGAPAVTQSPTSDGAWPGGRRAWRRAKD
jgi:polysaccharide deacetylase family protein (PEP-CTERM system associated)